MRRTPFASPPLARPIVFVVSSGLLIAAFLSACRDEESNISNEHTSSLVACGVSTLRYPTNREDFEHHLYLNRGFYTDGNHLGDDILLPEGTPIHPIACGTVRIYRPAKGYGTLVVVIEHRLPQPIVVKNGLGEQVTITSFLTIYGHLRRTTLINGGDGLAIREGDTVSPDDVIGYVQNEARNGDGAEHLHLGIRLQSMNDAERTDVDWFRGYDANPSQRRWFADPADFLPTLMMKGTVRSHPVGTVLTHDHDANDVWMVGQGDLLHSIGPFVSAVDHLNDRAIPVTDEELACYGNGVAYVPELTGVALLKFDDAPAVYEYSDLLSPVRYAFISQEAFNSWGWQAQDIKLKPANDRPAFLARYQDKGFRRLRDGALVKGRGLSEVAVVSDGRRLPIFDWSTFLAMGYKAEQIVEVDPLTLDEVAYLRGPLITPETAAYCAHPKLCVNGSCDAGVGGGGIEVDASIPMDLLTIAPDLKPVSKQMEICNGLDDDGNGQIDEIFLCPLGHRGPICVTSCGVGGYRVCEAPRCDWSLACYPFPETCDNTIDDDCDGKVDCDDTDCQMAPYCRKSPMDIAVSMDAGVSPPDLNLPTPDLNRPSPDMSQMLNDQNHGLYIEAGPNLKASCQTGIVIVAWDPQGKEARSAPGQPLNIQVGLNWRSWVMMTTICSGQYHGNWQPKDGSALDAGFISVRLGNRELVRLPHMVCPDPYDGQRDLKLAIPFEMPNEGVCP